MKKIRDFILSMILPRKTAKFRNMHFALALLIYLVAMFIAIGSQFMVSESMVKKEMPRSEYEDSFKDYQVVGDYDVSEQNFYIEKLEITSDTTSKIDPKEDNKRLTSKLLVADLANESDHLYSLFSFSEDFTNELLKKTELSDEENNQKKYTQKRLEDLYKGAKKSKEEDANKDVSVLIVLFTKDYLYYGLNLDLNNVTEDYINNATLEELINQLHAISYDEINIDEVLSYIRRLSEKDICAFVNSIIQTLNLALPNYTLVNSHTNFDYYVDTYFKQKGIYHKIITKNNDFLDVTLVIDANYSAFSTDEKNNKFEHFDYEGYTKQKRQDNTTYVLCVFSSDRFYFIYDLGQTFQNGKYVYLDYQSNSIFESTGDKEIERLYYLPSSPSELTYNQYGQFDTTKWTKVVGQNEQFDYDSILSSLELPKNIKEDDVKAIKPVDRHQKNFYNAIYTIHSRGYNYNDFLGSGFATSQLNAKINVMLQSIVNAMVSINAANYELVYGIMSFGISILFPLLLTLVIWALSRKLVMKRYRQYYAIGSICYFNISIISFIVGFFVSFSDMAFILMFVQAWYFIFVTFRINTDPKYKNDQDNQSNDNNDISKPEFKKVKEHKSAQVG